MDNCSKTQFVAESSFCAVHPEEHQELFFWLSDQIGPDFWVSEDENKKS